MIPTMIKTMIRLAFFSLKAVLNNDENSATQKLENKYCFFHLILYITHILEKEKIRICFLLSIPLQCSQSRHGNFLQVYILNEVLTW